MTPDQLRATLHHLGLTIRGAASFLGVRERIVYRWLSGEHPVPEAVSKLLRLMVAMKLTPAKVERKIAMI